MEYSREFQVRAAKELDMLAEGAAIAERLAAYSVKRDQAEGVLATDHVTNSSPKDQAAA